MIRSLLCLSSLLVLKIMFLLTVDASRTGRFLYALGNVKASQGLFDESFSYHQRALLQYKSTIGKNHHRTGDAYIKVADHFSRLGRSEDAMYVYPLSIGSWSSYD